MTDATFAIAQKSVVIGDPLNPNNCRFSAGAVRKVFPVMGHAPGENSIWRFVTITDIPIGPEPYLITVPVGGELVSVEMQRDPIDRLNGQFVRPLVSGYYNAEGEWVQSSEIRSDRFVFSPELADQARPGVVAALASDNRVTVSWLEAKQALIDMVTLTPVTDRHLSENLLIWPGAV
ncbi:hypothetical protein [Candidatus Endoriftia persephonae]|jgi:hypothetical protein|uniref:Uncharacterized protein n=1 Tax=Candidatus Endoriftia persephonae TaxID=393765 RepID=A0A9J7A1E2_9GAMM|nr:hypothetical protein [Candidatus Endoriftia persephone]USF88740.1 hypothetical protein L0Y14_05775 [Candidatus Endoriftia persephone]